MRAQTLSIAVFLATTTTAFGQAGLPPLSPADCALLNAEYGVTPVGCAAPPAPVKAAARMPSPIETAPLPELTTAMRQSHIFFPGGGSALDDAARVQLVGLIALLNGPRLTGSCLKLVGHSDSSGAAAINQHLSEQRARTVAAFLSAALGTLRVVEASGAGFDQPLEGFPPAARENRRVAIHIGQCSAVRGS